MEIKQCTTCMGNYTHDACTWFVIHITKKTISIQCEKWYDSGGVW